MHDRFEEFNINTPKTIMYNLGIDINEILRNCSFSDTFIKEANDLQIMEAINECYDEYKLLEF